MVKWIRSYDLLSSSNNLYGLSARLNLQTDNGKLTEFTRGYVWSRRYSNGWKWVDRLDRVAWSNSQIGRFLSYLPFTWETWNRASDWLEANENEYWETTSPDPYATTDGDIGFTIDKLIEYGRPRAAIRCLDKIVSRQQPLDMNRTIRALLAALSSTEPFDSMNTYNIIEIIKTLQDDPATDPEDLFKVEWYYLPLLDGHLRDAFPKTLENKLASDPDFFCEVIRHVYRSTKTDTTKQESNEQNQSIAMNGCDLLREWRTPPGMQRDGTFLSDKFRQWLAQVEKICDESGYLEVVLSHIGRVFIHCPSDPDGLWIHHSVADAMNDDSADIMRTGYHIGIYNSRGAHFTDLQVIRNENLPDNTGTRPRKSNTWDTIASLQR